MIDLITSNAQALAAAENNQWDLCATLINATIQPRRKGIEESRLTWVGLQDKIGETMTVTIRSKLSLARKMAELTANAALSAASPDMAAAQTATGQAEAIGILFDSLITGASFADQRTQERINYLAAGGLIATDEAAALRGLGFHPATIYTAQQVENQWKQYQTSQLREQADAAISAALTDSHLKTSWVTALRAAANAMEV